VRSTCAKERLRALLSAEQNHRCCYCGVRTENPRHKQRFRKNINPLWATIDHVVPAADGGKLEYDNAVMSCHGCNNLKQNAPIDTWLFVCSIVGRPVMIPPKLPSRRGAVHFEIPLLFLS